MMKQRFIYTLEMFPLYTNMQVWFRGLNMHLCLGLTRQRPGQSLDFDAAQLSAPQVDVFIGVEL